MKEIIICNAMPLYQEAPVPSEIFKADSKKIIDILMQRPAKRHVLITNQEISDVPEGLEVINPAKTSGLVFGNYSSLLKVTENEKPIPYKSNLDFNDETTEFLSVEEILEQNTKSTCVDICGKISCIDIPEYVTPKEILEKVNAEDDCKAVYFGYPMGIFIDEKSLDEKINVTTDYIKIFNNKECMLDGLLKIVNIYQRETCGRCVFGHEGVTQLQMILTDMTIKRGKSSDTELILDLVSVMKNQTLCEIGEALANTVITCFDNFREEIENHVTKKVCKAGTCSKFLTYHILVDKCIGCGECMDECEDDAILGKRKFIHVIDQDECTQCGKCMEVCEEDAIIKAGADKPRGPKKPIPCKKK